jgi:hypothetical protein
VKIDAIRLAHAVGTYDKVDRSKQYENPDNHELLRAVNEAWSKIRVCEKAITSKDLAILNLEQRVSRYKFLNIALTSILTGLAWEGVKALVAYLR